MIRWRTATAWALLLSAAFVLRTALDWLAPTTDFHTRSSISTSVAAAVFFLAGAAAAWRSRRWIDGPLTAAAAAVLAAPISVAGVALLYALRHDAPVLQAITGSGGLAEALTLPLFLVIPGSMLGVIGGLCGAAARAIRGGAAPVH